MPSSGSYTGNVFFNCSSLKTISVTEGVATILYRAFYNANRLEEVILPSTLKTVGSYAFYNCTALKGVSLPDSVTSIGESAFRNCSAMTFMDLPASITSAGTNSIPAGTWKNGDLYRTESALISELSGGYAPLLAGRWVKVDDEGEYVYQYAILGTSAADSDNYETLTFIRTNTTYTNYTSGNVVDIFGNTYSNVMIASANNSFRASELEKKAGVAIKEIRAAEGQTAYYMTDISSWFSGLKSLTDFSGECLDTSHVKKMDSLFNGCTALKRADLSAFTTPLLTSANKMFSGCSSLTSVDVSSFDTSHVESMTEMFGTDTGCPELREVTLGPGFTVWKENAVLPNAGEWIHYGINVRKSAMELCREYPAHASEWAGTWRHSLNPEPQDIMHKQRTFQFHSLIVSDNNLKYAVEYDEHWFLRNPSTYNHKLAIMSLAMAVSSYADSGTNRNSDNIRELYQNLGFDTSNFTVINYPETDDHTIGYAIGVKNIRTGNGDVISLLAVTIRGGGYGKEWAGNFEVGTGVNHSGFEQAKEKVLCGLKAFIRNHPGAFSGNIKVWISGYSRAAATGNLLAASLDDGKLNDVLTEQGLAKLTKNDIFMYGFECPQNTTDKNAGASRYNNIHSVVNPIDIVTKVAFSQKIGWGYRRFGVVHTLYSTYNTNSWKYQKNVKPKMISSYEDLLNYNSNYDFNGHSPKENAENLAKEKAGQAVILNNFLNYLATSMGSKEIYTAVHQTQVMHIVRNTLGGGGETWWPNAIFEILALTYPREVLEQLTIHTSTLPVAIAEGAYLFVGGEPVLTGKDTIQTMRAHYPELCLAWMLAIRDNPDLSLSMEEPLGTKQQAAVTAADDGSDVQEVVFAPNTTRYLYISGDADISVYDPEGTLLGKIENNEAAEIETGVYCYIDDDGRKVFVLPNDLEYRIEMNPRSNGTLTYTCVETDYINQEENRLVSYQEMDVRKDEVLTGIIEDISEEGTEGSYKVYKDGQEAAAPVVLEEEEIVQYEVSVTTEGLGTVSGGGLYHSGDYAAVKVLSHGENFIGWYENGSRVSTDPEYRFTVEGDRSLTAVFGELTTARIKEVRISGISAAVGTSAGAQLKGLKVPSGVNYSIIPGTYTAWFCVTDGIYLEDTDVFEAGKEYSLRVLVEAAEGYAFSDTSEMKWYANDTEDLADPEVSCVGGDSETAFFWTKPFCCPASLPFVDVKEGKFYYEPVIWAYYHKPQITTGTDDTHFSPNNTCTRAQVVTFLWRASGCPEPVTTKNPFTDVKASAYFYKAVLWAVENNITTGLKDAQGNPTGKFDPNGACTRGQVVTFLYRANGSPSFETAECPFTDVKPKAFYYNATLWAVENDITTGMKDKDGNPTGLFAPNDSCTRGQVVTFLYRSR